MNNAKYLLSIVLSFLLFAINCTFAQKAIEEKNDGIVKLWLEAENGNIKPSMTLWDKNDASSGQYIGVSGFADQIQNAPTEGQVIYNFTLKNAGIYKIWGRVNVDMDDTDAFWVKVDYEDWVLWQDIKVGCSWLWDEVHDHLNNDQVMTFDLDAGDHTLEFSNALDHTFLDKILITNDLDFVPSEIGPGTQAAFKTDSEILLIDEKVQFDASLSTSTEGSVIKYDWDFGDGKNGMGESVNHTYNKAGDYKVKLVVKDDRGLSGRFSKTFTVYKDDPIASFNYSPQHSLKEQSISFDASASFHPNGELKNYSWDFGDGASAKGTQVKHSYSSAGEYSTTLSVTDSDGKTAKHNRLITIINGIAKKVIYETDMCLDVDDVGALAILHALANNKEAEILAVCFNEVHPFGASAIDAINTWYGRGDIPIGIYKKPLAAPDISLYLEPVSKLPNDINRKNVPSALEVYQKVLTDQADSSVTIISVGFLNNLNDLLNENPDLIAKKVKELVIMGGLNNDGFNLSRHNLVSASENIMKNWPTPLVLSQPGGSIFTGPGLKDTPLNNPVREGYYKFFSNNFCDRPSWDQVAVLYGVRGLSDYFSRNTTITGTLRNGFKYQMKAGHRSFLEPLLSNESYARIIQDLMVESPLK